jgi:hypothetical protein
LLIAYGLERTLSLQEKRKMSITIEHGVVGLAEADHRTANNLASLNGVIRLQRSAIGESGKTFTSDQFACCPTISARALM